MSTRSDIVKVNLDGSIEVIYCHSDGYLRNNGMILNEHYRNLTKVNQLISLGNLSVLAPKIELPAELAQFKTNLMNKLINFNWEEIVRKHYNDYCLAYHRDRGDKLEIAKFNSLNDYLKEMNENLTMIEFIYIYKEKTNNWYVTTYKQRGNGFKKPVTLKSALKKAQLIK